MSDVDGKQTLDSFYKDKETADLASFDSGESPKKTEKRKTLAQWKKEFEGGVEPEPGKPLLTEDQARGVIQRENLFQKAKALKEIIQKKRPLLKKNAQPPQQIQVSNEQPSSIRVRP